ncbi:hypothetical protein BHE74_00006313 [Ensete ventricosum]|nr:hypothetical protein GW17_00036460 [Ensete ventricosum]RWW85045.1 hypothetical protein BHE74_00006313 [Ensete ventricosum]
MLRAPLDFAIPSPPVRISSSHLYPRRRPTRLAGDSDSEQGHSGPSSWSNGNAGGTASQREGRGPPSVRRDSLHVAPNSTRPQRRKKLIPAKTGGAEVATRQIKQLGITDHSRHRNLRDSVPIGGDTGAVGIYVSSKRQGGRQASRSMEECLESYIHLLIIEIVGVMEDIVFEMDQLEKQAGDEVISLLQKDSKFNNNLSDSNELEVFHQAALRLGITSSRAALTERRALKKLMERARAQDDKRKESIVSYLYHLMRKYSKLFRSEYTDDTDSQGSTPRTSSILGFEEVSSPHRNSRTFERQLSKLRSFNFKQNGRKSGNMPIPPEEFICPISLQLMFDPVIISSGQTYERFCIEKWFNDGHSTCPKTQQQLSHLCLTPNYCVKGLIANWCEQNGFPIPTGPPESLDANYWRLAFSQCEAMDSSSFGCTNSCKLKCVKVAPLEENHSHEELNEADAETLSNYYDEHVVDEFERYRSLLSALHEVKSAHKQCRVVEQIRYLLKEDEEARIYLGANGLVEALIQFLRMALFGGDEKAQKAGAMALFNLAVNNNRY